MNQVAVLRWQIARGQCDAIPNRLSLRERRDYWASRLADASVALAVVNARQSWLRQVAPLVNR